MLYICRSGLSLTFLAAVASEDLQNYKASHLISRKSSAIIGGVPARHTRTVPPTALFPLK